MPFRDSVERNKYRRRYYQKNRALMLDYRRKYRESHRSEIKAKKAADYALNRRTILARCKVYYTANREKATSRARKYRAANPERGRATRNAYAAWRRAAKRKATPAWVDHRELEAIYKEASASGLTVDHIIPLKHEKVCGLHVPWNLQLLTASENCRKHNNFLCG